MEPSQSITTCPWTSLSVLCVVKVSLPNYLSLSEYVLLHRLIQTRSLQHTCCLGQWKLKILAKNLGICLWSTEIWSNLQLSLSFFSTLRFTTSPSKYCVSPENHQKAIHHLCFLWRTAESQHGKERKGTSVYEADGKTPRSHGQKWHWPFQDNLNLKSHYRIIFYCWFIRSLSSSSKHPTYSSL